MEDRSIVSFLFHQWGKRPAFQHPSRLVDKVLLGVMFTKIQCHFFCSGNNLNHSSIDSGLS